jgi:hypothetical protein
MNKTLPERYLADLELPKSCALHLDRDASEELARVLGGIGAPTESFSLTARMEAASDDLREGWA